MKNAKLFSWLLATGALVAIGMALFLKITRQSDSPMATTTPPMAVKTKDEPIEPEGIEESQPDQELVDQEQAMEAARKRMEANADAVKKVRTQL